jgi:peptide deformylase
MAVKEVLQFGNDILRQKAAAVSDFGSAENAAMMSDLKDTLADLQRIHGKGGGLAAPQIGISKAVTFINAKGRTFYVFNPVIAEKSKEMFDVWDFCFSCNASFLAKIARHRKITVDFQDENGDKKTEHFEGYFSELLQHEIDHLYGTLFIDRIKDPTSITMMGEWDRKYKYKQE